MRTLLFTLEYPPFKGGVANYYGNLVKYWPNHASNHLGLKKSDPEANIKVLDNNDGSLLWSFIWPHWLPAYWKLKNTVREYGIEHIFVGHILPLGTVAYGLHKKTGIPYTVMLHGMDLSMAMRPGKKQLIAKKILRNAENIICGNSYTANILYKYLGEDIKEKTSVVHPGVNPEFYVDKATYENIQRKYNLSNKKVLLSFGRLVERKGFEDVVKSLPKVVSKYPDLHYFISGDGPEKMKFLDYSMTNRNITYLGHLTEKEKNAWLASCDIFIMPSYSSGDDFEGFGIVYLEANIAGKPVIGGRSGGVPEAIHDGVSGLLVEPRNTDEISKAIIRLVEDPALAQKIGRQGKSRAEEWFNWDRQVALIYKIINS